MVQVGLDLRRFRKISQIKINVSLSQIKNQIDAILIIRPKFMQNLNLSIINVLNQPQCPIIQLNSKSYIPLIQILYVN